MDKKNNNPEMPLEDNWLEELLGKSDLLSDVEYDEQAVRNAGLTHPDDLELEKILQENWEESDKKRAQKRKKPVEAFPAEEEMPISLDFPEQAPAAPKPRTRQPRVAEGTQKPTQAAPKKRQPAKAAETPAEKRMQMPKAEPVRKQPEKAQEPPAKKKGDGFFVIPQFLTIILWLGIVLIIGVSMGRTLWACCADVMAFGKQSQQVVITITEQDDISDVSKKLGDAGLIRYPSLFKFFCNITGKSDNIGDGTYTLNSHLDYNAMVNAMTDYGTSREEVEIMFPEGYNCAQIFSILEENGVCTAADLEAYAAEGELEDYWFLEGVTRGDKYCLEGYLFPDTYQFYTNDEPRRVLEKFLNNFNYRFTDIMKEDFENMKVRYANMLASHGYGQSYIDSNPLTLKDLVIIASLIEKETSGATESYDIASVIYNRLTNQSSYPFLNIDAALVYALGGKTELTENDKYFDSPYNTYKYTGLIPGPICNPGRDSLYAALDPNDTNYYFYALNPATGSHHFTTSLSEHNAFLNSIG